MRSSRRIERRCLEDVATRVICANRTLLRKDERVALLFDALKQAADEGQLHWLQPDTTRTYGRCFIWTGQLCDQAERTQNDLNARLTAFAQTKDA